ncbi:putative maltokinase [Pseudomonas sp. PDM13]|uniref:putative maltokinase n=1 Tax=Pseudomonas sp. PDM13 TaxID=2769255 RepID=UPI0021DFD2CD|nr:putative maltokinase [Pseudomonas sp. PDM13]MCU9948374.1 putative maltokinase [Pseudomonas sp. PDM13]
MANQQRPELHTLVIEQDLQELLQGASGSLVGDSLAAYLPRRRWFSGDAAGEVRLLYAVPFGEADELCVLAEVESRDGERREHYQLPLAFVTEHQAGSAAPEHLALARLHRGRQVGLLTDAFTLPGFVRQVVRQLSRGQVLHWQGSELQFVPTSRLVDFIGDLDGDVSLVSAEQSNSSAVIGDSMVLKLVRRVLPGIHPETEMGGYLTEHGFANIPPLLGEVRRVDEAGTPHTLMVLQAFLSNQGDAWQWTLNTLERAVRDELAGGASGQESTHRLLEELEAFARMLGRRLGEMHEVLARPSDNPDFGYRSSDIAETNGWAHSVGLQLHEALERVAESREGLSESARALADWLGSHQAGLLEVVGKLARHSAGGIRIRVHGDLHLGQVLVARGDAFIIDFEGEPTRSLEERRARHSPLKDVAGMLRSFDYAAAMALRNAQGADASSEAASARQRIASTYRSQARTAFHEAYRLAAANLPHAWHERDGEVAALALFSIEKAAYEILYEARYRPDWLDVPMLGLVELGRHLLGSTQ